MAKYQKMAVLNFILFLKSYQMKKKSHLHIVAAGCRWSCARHKIRSRGLKFRFLASNIMKEQNPEFKVDPLKLVNFGSP